MGYEIIRSIRLDNKKQEVWLISCANNLYPHTPEKWECKSLSNIWKEKGKKEVQKEILYAFFSGEFQKGASKYARTIKYIDLNYPNHRLNTWSCKNIVEQKEWLFKKYSEFKEGKKEYVVKQGNKYLARKGSKTCYIVDNINHATKHRYLDAQILVKRYGNTGTIIKVGSDK